MMCYHCKTSQIRCSKMVELEELHDIILKFNVIHNVIDDEANLNR